MSKLKVVIVGAGVVGLSAAYHLVNAGAAVTLVDREPDGDKASIGNAGGIAVTEVIPASAYGVSWRLIRWMLDPLGPLAVRPSHLPKLVPWLVQFAKVSTPQEISRIALALAAINSRVYADLLPMLSATGLSGLLHRNGALTVYETERGYQRDAAEWAIKRSLGVLTEEVSAPEARRLEPALGRFVRRAVFTPQWSHISDPRLLLEGIRKWLADSNAIMRRGEVQNVRRGTASPLAVELDGGASICADKVVIAAGAWSEFLVRRIGDRAALESERGYNTTLRNPGVVLQREVIFAERKFVATPLSCGLRIGGAAEFGGLTAMPDFRRSRALLELASMYLPELRKQGGTVWAGHRPATPDSLPVIGSSDQLPDVLYAFGHGHLGLTQAATTGRLITDLAFCRKPEIELAPYRVGRFSRK